ncbi:DEAD/DEAH box helicase [Rodentibacter trehalosifermentans]|uniref:DEAD/DEAH box helicase n=1 Tax=Rodentibacter trehalosifermentans TaxID=1908263 RepID=UPI0009842F30|nr:DEAD/DEAH box helicase family protein [Rodentibacter trehalosifermentans]OOF47488.1 DNA helicase [Rodentibacter trehalosifermentans]
MIGLTLKDFQQQAVDFLMENARNRQNQKTQIVVKSPTGSGKTIIMVGFVETYLQDNPESIICWFSVGKGDLEEQSREKMERFAPTLKTGNITDILNSGFEMGTSYFINWETITKKDNLALKESERKNLKQYIAEAHRENRQFVIIIDEEHLNNTAKANDIIDSLASQLEIRVSATPIKNPKSIYYEIDEVDVINEGLITRAMYINKDLNVKQMDNVLNETTLLLEKADYIRQKISAAYLQENEQIRPLVLIQFPNLNDELIEFVENKLNAMGYNYENGLVAKWMSEENKKDKERKSTKLGKINVGGINNSDSITLNNATPVFLLFKQALATGWDCPRAKVLVKLRENMSETFEIQTLGRLRRMPNARHYGKDILDCSYLYTFDEAYKEAVRSVGGEEYKRVFLKDEPKHIRLFKELRHKDADFSDDKAVRERLFHFIKVRYKLTDNLQQNRQRFENNGFWISDEILTKYLQGRFNTLNQIQETPANYHSLRYQVNTHIHGMELRHNIDSLKNYAGLSYDKLRTILEIFFLNIEVKSKYQLLALTRKEFYAFIINNRDEFKSLFSDFSRSKIQGELALDVLREPRETQFSIPLEENYPYNPNSKAKAELVSNVYREYSEMMIGGHLRSTCERLFEKYCEATPDVKFIYKNGDTGQNYLSIVYTTNMGKQRLFYPDYIVQKTNGEIWLIETKGGEDAKGNDKNIDDNAGVKFDALKQFCQKHHYHFGFVRDKDGELYLNNQEYSDMMADQIWQAIKNFL